MNLTKLYTELLAVYGYQGWWPLLADEADVGRFTCYHPENYQIPQNNQQRLEICIGAILTQNTNWLNVEKALFNLQREDLMSAQAICEIDKSELAQYIKPSGYYNQKARKLQEFCAFFIELGADIPNRVDLLDLWGIGRETADSMLLYAWKQPVMVIDSYSRRVFKAEGCELWNEDYDVLKKWCEEQLTPDHKILQEFHALLVKAGKQQRLVR